MKGFRALACALLISLPVLGYSGTLVVSQDLALEYPEPELISHSSNMLIHKKRSVLPSWLRLLAEEQVREFGLPKGEGTSQKVDQFELLGTYSKQHRSGYLYVFDRAAVHHIVIQGTEEPYQEVINNIREQRSST